MRIGILTFHRAHNYGAVLQCFALQRFLQNQGHQVKVIDYTKKDLWRYYEWFKREEVRYALSSPKKALNRCAKLCLKWARIAPRYYAFVRFRKHNLDLCSLNEIDRHPFDLILIGSDQVWNPSITNGFDVYYWGQFNRPPKTKVATYAASLMRIWNKEDLQRVHEYLKSLNAISVRERDVAIFLKGLDSSLDPVVVPDPVFLLSVLEWKGKAIEPPIDEAYVFFYQAKDSEDVYQIAARLASEKKKRLVVLSANVNGRNSYEARNASPLSFLGWIKNAEMVVTSSLHATALSIILNKDFICVDLGVGEDRRLKSLLEIFGLGHRFIHTYDDLCTLSFEPYDCNEIIHCLQNTAARFIASIV